MVQSCGDLAQGTSGLECGNEIAELVASLHIDDVFEGRRAELERDVLEVLIGRVIKIANNIGVTVGLAEDVEFAHSKRNKMGHHTLDGDVTALEQALEHYCAARTVA